MDHPSLKNLTAVDFSLSREKQNEFLASLGVPHLDSFNYMIHSGLNEAVKSIKEAYINLENEKISIKIESLRILPSLAPPGANVKNPKIFPSECRQRASTYNGRLIANITWSINGEPKPSIQHDFGRIPIMVKSDLCHLKGLSPKELVKNNEHAEEWGGYFIVKGSEKIIRMLLMTRRNFPIAVKRKTWKQRGPNFSDVGIMIRCVQKDHTSMNNVLHFVTDGTAKLMVSYHRSLFYVPIILVMKCLLNASDEHLFKSISAGYENDFYMKGCILSMIRDLQSNHIITHDDARCYVGRMFRSKVMELPPEASDTEICDFILESSVCIHLDDFRDKYNCLVFMVQKLFCVVQNKCIAEGVDTIMTQELLLGGHLYQQVVKDRLQSWLSYLKQSIVKEAADGKDINLTKANLEKCMRKCGSVERTVEHFLSTGNVSISVPSGAQQTTGLVIVAENINRMRYMSHFRAVHRGSYFQEMRTTEVRQLQPDAWGFICPVHTPDGTPCGLLNHLTKSVK